MNTADTPVTRKPKISRKWTGLILAMVIGIASFIGHAWARGQGWSTYNQSNSDLLGISVEALAIDGQGQVWMGTPQGISVLGVDGKWSRYQAGGDVTSLAVDDKGQAWVGTGDGLRMITPDGEVKKYTHPNRDLASDRINSLAVDARGQVWIGTPEGLYLLLPDDTWEVFTPRNSALADYTILALEVDSDDRVWIGTGNGLTVLTPDGRWQTFTEANSGLAADTVTTLAIDAEGKVWAGSAYRNYKGLSVLSPDGQWQVYSKSNSGLASDNVSALAFDAQGNLWVGGGSWESAAGVSELTPDGQWRRYTQISSGLMDNRVNDLAGGNSLRGKLYVGTRKGLAVFQPEAGVPQSVILGLLVLGQLSMAALIIQVAMVAGMAWERKRQEKLGSSQAEVDLPRKYALFAGGFLGWYLVNGLIWLVMARDGFDLEGSGILNLCLLPINLVLLLVFARKPSTRFIGLGILSALAANLFISLILGMATNAGCFIPFFINT